MKESLIKNKSFISTSDKNPRQTKSSLGSRSTINFDLVTRLLQSRSTKICYSDLWSWKMKKEAAAKRAKLTNIPTIPQIHELNLCEIEKFFRAAEQEQAYLKKNASKPSVLTILKDQGLSKLSKCLKNTWEGRSFSQLKPRKPAINKRKSINFNQSFEYIIDTCEHENELNRSLSSSFIKDSKNIMNKYQCIIRKASSGKQGLKESEIEEMKKYQLKVNEITDSHMFKRENLRQKSVLFKGTRDSRKKL
ncbi:unnamed protein product [Blepharisma stoltei]|uniref:Uncharacterized protein n=1 Tax=Blepharisma stoltei TaxID=1481888 RepID=A0AAU9IXE7_9CILI|nr:unnamed protein product [Blepharisma stoltei]